MLKRLSLDLRYLSNDGKKTFQIMEVDFRSGQNSRKVLFESKDFTMSDDFSARLKERGIYVNIEDV